MASAREHYEEAERLLDQAYDTNPQGQVTGVSKDIVDVAQVHALLAMTAATAGFGAASSDAL